MKRIIIITIIFFSFAFVASAQPLPPATPNGNPVPVNGLMELLPIVLAAWGLIQLRKKKEKP